jgi:mannosylfructose-phosphate synthase
MTAIEAMACGTPTVVTTEGGLFKLTQWGQECLYANPFDPESFGHAITTLLQFPEVHDRLAVQGARKARENFTWTHMAQEILQQLETLSVASPRTSSKARKERDQWLAIGSSSAT